MITASTPSLDVAARQVLAAALSAALSDPRTDRARPPAWLTAELLESSWGIVRAALDENAPAPATLTPAERHPREVDISQVWAWLTLPIARRESVHQAIFGVLAPQDCPPLETEYLRSNDSAHRAQALADIAGFYRALGLEPPDRIRQRHDHVALELEFLAFVYQLITRASVDPPADPEAAARCEALALAFFKDHMAWWMPTFGRSIERHIARMMDVPQELANPALSFQDVSAFAGVARFLTAWIACERHWLALPAATTAVRPRPAELLEDGSCAIGCSDIDRSAIDRSADQGPTQCGG